MKISFPTKPYDNKKIFYKNYIEVSPGVTILVGCNGAGKTTMIKSIVNHCEKNKIPYIYFDNYSNGGKDTKDNLYNKTKDPQVIADLWGASEGETTNYNLQLFARQVGSFVNEKDDSNIRMVLLDGVDSGFSIDNIVELKTFFHFVVDDAKTHNIECYIIATANTYEMTADEQCIDVISCKPITFDSYAWYKDYIMSSAKIKSKR